MILLIDPKSDFGFKRLFGRDTELSEALRVSVVNSLVEPLPRNVVKSLAIDTPFQDKEESDDFQGIIDIRCIAENGVRYILEMQLWTHAYLRKRWTFYVSKEYPTPLQSGDNYRVLRPVILICIIDDTVIPGHPDCSSWDFRLRDSKRPQVCLTNDLQIIVLEVSKFAAPTSVTWSPKEQWSWFFQNCDRIDTDFWPVQINLPAIQKAKEELMQLSSDPAVRRQYEASLVKQREINALKDTAEMEKKEAFDCGEQSGFDKGEAKAVKRLVIPRIQRIQKKLQRPVTPLDQLEAMPQAALEKLGADLDRDLLGDVE